MQKKYLIIKYEINGEIANTIIKATVIIIIIISIIEWINNRYKIKWWNSNKW